MSFVYIMEAEGLGIVKIGYAADPWHRLAKVATDCPVPVKLAAIVAGGVEFEGELHARFAEHRHKREWFTYAPPIREYVAGLPDLVTRERQRKQLGGPLGAWLAENNMSAKAFAAEAGLHHGTISRVCAGKLDPSRSLLLAVHRFTNGEVTPNHMLGIEA